MPSTAEDWDAAIADFGEQGTHHMQNMSWGQLKKLQSCSTRGKKECPEESKKVAASILMKGVTPSETPMKLYIRREKQKLMYCLTIQQVQMMQVQARHQGSEEFMRNVFKKIAAGKLGGDKQVLAMEKLHFLSTVPFGQRRVIQCQYL
eukprot:3644458-Amphidinium_carterae.1